MRTIYKKTRLWVLLAFAIVLPFLLSTQYWMHVVNVCGIFAILTVSLNLLTGCTGLFSVGHVAFYGIGAYTSAILTTRFGIPVWLGFIAAGIMTALCSLILGLPTARLRGLYLAVATLAFGEIAYQLFVNWGVVTNGTKGIIGIPAPEFFGFSLSTYTRYYYLILAILVLAIVLVHNLLNSRMGRALLSIRGNEAAASAMGVNTTQYKIIAFMCSAFLAGVAGALYAHEVAYISPDTFKAAESTSVLAMMVIGGIGHIGGSVLGAIALTVIPELLRNFGDVRLVLYGLSIVAIVVLSPKGLGGLIDWLDDVIMGIRHPFAKKSKAVEGTNGDYGKEVEK